MTMMKHFDFEEQAVRIEMREGAPWFVAADVCRVLEISNPRNVVARLDDDEKGVHTVDTLGGPQEMTIINESGLYSLILTSRKPAAKRFKKWVTAEVLPTLRRTGAYVMTPDDEDLPSLADGRIFGLRVATVNAAARLISVANSIYGPDAARELWKSDPRLPDLSHKAVGAMSGAADDDPVGCLRHLMRAAIQGRSLADLLFAALDDGADVAALGQYGLSCNASFPGGAVGVALAHPFLARHFAETQWVGSWATALRNLPGASVTRQSLFFHGLPSRAVMLPIAGVRDLVRRPN